MAKVDAFEEFEELHETLNPPKSKPGDQLELLEDISQLETLSYAEAPVVKKVPKNKPKIQPTKETGAGLSFEEVSKSHNDLTSYDRLQVDLTWISEANTRAYESIQMCIREMRKKDRYIDQLLKERGDEPISKSRVFGIDPPKDEDMRKTVIIDEIWGNRFTAILIIVLFILGISFFAAVVAFIMRNV